MNRHIHLEIGATLRISRALAAIDVDLLDKYALEV